MKSWVAVIVCIIVVEAAVLIGGYALIVRFQQGDANRETILERDRNQDEALRKFLCYFEKQALKDPATPKAQRTKIVKFFRGARALIHAKPCN